MNEYEVVVVGGGPAGAATAAFCAQRGLRVLLIEHKVFPRHKVCGDVINPGCWPVLDRLGIGPRLRAQSPYPLTGARFTDPKGGELDIPLAGLTALPRRLLDSCLLDHARGCGVTVREGETVHDVRGHWRVITGREEFAAPIVVGADGRHSLVAQRTGLARGRPRPGPVAFQSHFPAPKPLDDRVQLHLFPGGYCGIARLDATRANLCIVTAQATASRHPTLEELFAETVWRNPRFRDLGLAPEPLEPLHSAAPLWRRPNWPGGDGVFLVGDAGRVVEPFTGQGIFFALRTAELAAERIHAGPREYAAAVGRLYRQRAVTNGLLRRFLDGHRASRVVMTALRHCPAALHWLAGNVVQSETVGGPDRARSQPV